MKLFEGPHVAWPTIGALDRGYADEWRAVDRVVIGWGRLTDDPVAEARRAVDLCRKYRLAGFVANAEVEYEGSGRWKSLEFVQEFRRLAPRAPLALSFIGYGYPYRDLDFLPWKLGRAVFMPQAYPNHDGRSLSECMGAAWRAWKDGIGPEPKEYAPTIGVWQGSYGYNVDRYVYELRQAQTYGVNLFLGETATDDDYRKVGSAIRTHGIAQAV